MKISDVTKATGLSQSQIAHKLGLHRSAVTRCWGGAVSLGKNIPPPP